MKISSQGAARRRDVRRENLIAALDAIGSPLFIVGTAGEVLHVNANGRLMFDRDRRGLEQSFARTVAGETDDRGWALIPLSDPSEPPEFLAIPRPASRETAATTSSLSPSLQAARARWKLTARQAEVLELVAHGLTNANIAATLGIAEGTVEYHVASIFNKARVQNRASLIACLHEI